VALTPGGRRIPLSGAGAPRFVELSEQGFYEIRGRSSTRPISIVAANLDPAESDLTPMDPRELVAAAIGHAVPDSGQRDAAPDITAQDAEKRQGVWWYLLLAGGLLLAAETLFANRLSKTTTTV
jgi:hypothetical protein